MPKITVNVPAKIAKELLAQGKPMGFRKLETTVESLIVAAHMHFVVKRAKQ